MKIFCRDICEDVPTVNGHIYDRHSMECIAAMSNGLAMYRRSFVVIDDARSFGTRVTLAATIGLVTDVSLVNGRFLCDIELLDVPRARLFQGIDTERISISPLITGLIQDDRPKAPTLTLQGWLLQLTK